jgi:xylulokinase
MEKEYLVGIDLGTTLAKCVIYDSSGEACAEAQVPMQIRYPRSGEAEQEAMDFYTMTCALLRSCLKHPGIDPHRIAGVGIDSQMGGIMSVDHRFQPVTYYDTPLDNRSASENLFMHQNYGDLILEKNGSFSTYGNKILYWKKRNEWKQIAKFLQPSAFVAGKLAGFSGREAYIDQTFLCFSGLSDLRRTQWSEQLCEILQVNMDKLPRIVASTEIIGEVSRRAAEDTGLATGTPIAAGCGDQAAGFVGAGILQEGQMVDVAGTACILGASVAEYRFDARHRTLACLKAAIGEGYYLISVVLGGRTHNWFIEEFCGPELKNVPEGFGSVYEYLDSLAAKVPAGSDGLVSINYLQGRFFPPDPTVRGLFIGHTWAHSRMHFYRSVLESIAYDHYLTREIIRELLPGLKLGAVTAIGSGANSELWMRIKADVLQAPYQSLSRSDLSTLGSAIIAGYAVGLFRDAKTITERFVKPKRTIQPQPGAERSYRRNIEVYRDLFDLLHPVYRRLAGQEA